MSEETKAKSAERIAIDFNVVMRNRWGDPYRTAQGKVTRLGQVVVDALDAEVGPNVDAVTKRRLDQLATAIINPDFGTVEVGSAGPFRILELPARVVKTITDAIDKGYTAGIYSEAYRHIFGDAAEVESFDGVEILAAPKMSEIEDDDGTVADYITQDDDDTE